MIFLLAALALQPQLIAPPPGYVSTDPPMVEGVATDPATGIRLIKETCWDLRGDPVRLQAVAEQGGFNFHWTGSRRERHVGTGTGTLSYADAGAMKPRGSEWQCDLFMRIEPSDHEALVTALAAALGLPSAEPSSARGDPNRWPPTRETHWVVPERHATLQIELVSYEVRRGGNVHFFVSRYPGSGTNRPRRRR